MSDLPPPRLPYRDAALLHGLLAAVIVVVAWISGGSAAKAIVIAALYFVAATGWSWWRFRQREAKAAAQSTREGGEGI